MTDAPENVTLSYQSLGTKVPSRAVGPLTAVWVVLSMIAGAGGSLLSIMILLFFVISNPEAHLFWFIAIMGGLVAMLLALTFRATYVFITVWMVAGIIATVAGAISGGLMLMAASRSTGGFGAVIVAVYCGMWMVWGVVTAIGAVCGRVACRLRARGA